MKLKDVKKLESECLGALSEGRIFLRKKLPYISQTLYGLVPYPYPGLAAVANGPIAVTKGMVLVVDPEWFCSLPVGIRAGCLLHECQHIVRGLDRLERLPNKKLANLAFDIPINHDIRELVADGILLPDWVAYPEKYGVPPGLTGEAYYALLAKQDPDADQFADGMCGNCTGNGISPEIEDKIDDEWGRPKSDQQRIRKATLQELEKVIGKSRCGISPGETKEILEIEKKESLVPWKYMLNHVVRRTAGRIKAGRSDFSIHRPSKRSYVIGMLRPGMVDREINIMLIEDSSGSMNRKVQIPHVRTEFASVLRQLGIQNAWFMDADADVNAEPRRVRVADLHKLPIHGGGGTNFGPALKRAENFRPKPDLIIYATDGDGVAPSQPPKGIEVVWCIVPTDYGRRPAWWGHLVVCTDDMKLRLPYEAQDQI